MRATALLAAARCHQALGHPVRLRLLAALRDGQLCVGELQELSGLALSTVSRHISELERAGLLEQSKEGRWVWCRLGGEPRVGQLLECVWEQIAGDPAIEWDRQRAQRLRDGRQSSGCAAPAGPCIAIAAPLVSHTTGVPEEME